MNTDNKTGYKSTLKSEDTEEFLDIYFYRPVGYRWALFFRKIGISPNQITIASIFIGMASGICFYFTDTWINLLGIVLLIWANSYDSADGQLARMTNQKSALGRILDGACGDFWFISIYLSIIFRLWPQWGYWILILALVAGYSHSKQAAMADYFRNIHLLFLQGKKGSELDNSKDLAAKHQAKTWKNQPFIVFFDFMYLNYTKGQEKWTPQLQKMFHIINKNYQGESPEWFRVQYRKKSLPYIQYTNLLSFNLRSIVLFISVLINLPWIYFVFEITIMNVMLYYMVRQYEHIGKECINDLKTVDK